MSRPGPKGRRCPGCTGIHAPPMCKRKPPPAMATPEQMVAELVRVDAVLRSAGIESEKSGGIAATVMALVNERLQLQQLRMQIALAQPAKATAPSATQPEQRPAAKDAPAT